MIEKMKVVHIVAAASEKTALLDRLRTLGIVHFGEKASADQRHLERFAQLSRMDMALQEYAARAGRPRPCPTRTLSLFIRSWPTAWSAARPAGEENRRRCGGGEADRVGRLLPGGAAGAEGPGLRHPRLPDG